MSSTIAIPAPRIAALEPPYEPAVDATLRAMMPRGTPLEPLRAFRTFARSPALAEAMLPLGRFVLGRSLPLTLHERELLIDRVCARCGCEYEWGVHAAYFGERAALSPAMLAATVNGGADHPAWSGRDRLLVRLVDELHETATVSDSLWSELAARWDDPQLLALLLVVGWYHAIAFLLNGARVAREDWAPGFAEARAGEPDGGPGRAARS